MVFNRSCFLVTACCIDLLRLDLRAQYGSISHVARLALCCGGKHVHFASLAALESSLAIRVAQLLCVIYRVRGRNSHLASRALTRLKERVIVGLLLSACQVLLLLPA